MDELKEFCDIVIRLGLTIAILIGLTCLSIVVIDGTARMVAK